MAKTEVLEMNQSTLNQLIEKYNKWHKNVEEDSVWLQTKWIEPIGYEFMRFNLQPVYFATDKNIEQSNSYAHGREINEGDLVFEFNIQSYGYRGMSFTTTDDKKKLGVVPTPMMRITERDLAEDKYTLSSMPFRLKEVYDLPETIRQSGFYQIIKPAIFRDIGYCCYVLEEKGRLG